MQKSEVTKMKYETIKKKIAPAVGALMIAAGSFMGPKAMAEEVEKPKVEAVQEEAEKTEYKDSAKIINDYADVIEKVGKEYDKKSADLFAKADKEELTDKQYDSGLDKLTKDFEKELKQEEAKFNKATDEFVKQIGEYTREIEEFTKDLEKTMKETEKTFYKTAEKLNEMVGISLDLIENVSDGDLEKVIQQYAK